MDEKTKKTLIGFIVVIVLAIAVVVTVGIGTSWFTNKDIRTWFNFWGKGIESDTKEEEVFAVSDTGRLLHDGGVYKMPSALTVVSEVSENTGDEGQFVPEGSIALIASINNSYIDGEFDFSCYFETQNAWSIGRAATDYITLSPVNENGVCTNRNSKTLSIAQPFQVPIIIKAALKDSNSYATCKINCLQRLTHDPENITLGGTDATDESTVEIGITLGVGTVKGKTVLNSLTLSLDDTFKREVSKRLKFDVTFKSYSYDLSKTKVETLDNYIVATEKELDYSMFIDGYDSFSQQKKEAIYYAWNSAYFALGWHKNNIDIDVSLNYFYQDNLIYSIEESKKLGGEFTGALYGSDVSFNVEFNNNITL